MLSFDFGVRISSRQYQNYLGLCMPVQYQIELQNDHVASSSYLMLQCGTLNTNKLCFASPTV